MQVQELQELNTRKRSSLNENSSVIKIYNLPHKPGCSTVQTNSISENQTAGYHYKKDLNYLDDLIRKQPLQTPQWNKYESFKNKYDYSLTQIKNMLAKIRKQMFPTEKQIVFSKEYCQTKDSIHIFMTRQIYVNESVILAQTHEYVILGIFAKNPMLLFFML